VGERELHLGHGELHRIDALQVLGGNGGSADDLNGTGPGPVPTGHFIVQLRNGPGQGDISEFAVHVVRPGAGRVTEPDAVVLHDASVLFLNFHAVENFTGRLLHFAELMHVVPELRLGYHRVGSEDDHPVRLGVRVVVSGGLAAHHLIAVHNSSNSHSVNDKINKISQLDKVLMPTFDCSWNRFSKKQTKALSVPVLASNRTLFAQS
jgi:hypothetical protein